jgi:signal transduction histidine kinase
MLSGVIKNSPNGVLVANPEGIIEYFNDAYLNHVSKKKEDIYDKNIIKDPFLIPQDIADEIYDVVITNKNIWTGEIKTITKNNEEKYFYVTITSLTNNANEISYLVELIQDITPYSLFYKQFQIEKEKLDNILNIVPEGLILFDNFNKAIEMNKPIQDTYFKIYAIDLSTVLKEKSIFQIIDQNIFLDTIKNLLIGKETRITIQPKKGLFLDLLKVKSTFGCIIVVYNITDFVKFNEFRDNLISTVSHELRSPIAVIHQSLFNLTKYDQSLEKSQKEKLLDIALKNSSLLRDIVEDLLVISQIESNKIDLTVGLVNLYEIIRNVLSEFSSIFENKHQIAQFSANDEAFIYGDQKRIAQIIRILVDNASKYSHENSKIEINYFPSYKNNDLYFPAGYILEIGDHGIGISEDDVPHLFTKFFRAKNAQFVKGTGLGLVIAKEFVELHNGTITINTKIDEGTKFSLFFPLNNPN